MRIPPMMMRDACDIFWLLGQWEGISNGPYFDLSGLYHETRGNVQAYFWN